LATLTRKNKKGESKACAPLKAKGALNEKPEK
jgi:hypothetical protein